jgi:hypothetical protein
MTLDEIKLSPAEVGTLLTARSSSLTGFQNMIKAYNRMTPEQKVASTYGAFSIDNPMWRNAYGVTVPGTADEIAESFLALSKAHIETTLKTIRQQVEIK